MRRSRSTNEQIVEILRERAGGDSREECRQHGIAAKTYSRCKAQFGELQATEASRLKALEENRCLQRVVAGQALNI